MSAGIQPLKILVSIEFVCAVECFGAIKVPRKAYSNSLSSKHQPLIKSVAPKFETVSFATGKSVASKIVY